MSLLDASADVRRAYEALETAILEQRPATTIGGSVTSDPGYEQLRTLAERHGADKGVGKDSNCPAYELYLQGLSQRPVNLLEIGIDTGGSLRMWRDYFPAGKIYGLDIENKTAHAADRIDVSQGSQDDAVFLRSLASRIGSLDVIIDDGSHVSAHVILSFETLYPSLKPGGIYIVEDVGTSYWPHYGGSRDANASWTMMNYFKRAADWVQRPFAQGETDSSMLASLEFVHFWPNFIVMRKRRD